MQVILMERISSLGQLGDIVKVRDGYARNFLIPQGKARRATEANIAEVQSKRVELEKAQNQALASAQERVAKIDGLMVQITQKAGADGRLFGSVTNADIAAALEAQGFEIERGQIRLTNGPLKQIGDHPVPIVLQADITATIMVSVLGES
ncbi:MAG: 50S ribosomal protein L9 [Burkholderiales bacterium]|nr:50S ribosomal protein L9 [Burkholderiales bacterium]